jgi:hypothetical protein
VAVNGFAGSSRGPRRRRYGLGPPVDGALSDTVPGYASRLARVIACPKTEQVKIFATAG